MDLSLTAWRNLGVKGHHEALKCWLKASLIKWLGVRQEPLKAAFILFTDLKSLKLVCENTSYIMLAWNSFHFGFDWILIFVFW